MQYIALNNGITMPSIGLGTYELCGQKGVKIMQNALQIGYRFFDTAQMCKNEKELNLQNLGLEYVDLLVIHEPYENTKEMYQACEEAYHKGLTRTVEVLNFYGRYFKDFLDSGLIKGYFLLWNAMKMGCVTLQKVI
ncbi:aldo/keto reductase [Campylobacter upsaliensis]